MQPLLNDTVFSLWFTAYQQEKPLVQHIRLLNAARKEAIEFSPGFLTTQVRAELVRRSFPPLIFDIDEGSLGPRPFYGHLQTADAWTLHQRRDRGLAWHDLAG